MSIYIGEIVDIDDPLFEGRARIRVFGIFDDLDIEDIPWATQINGISFGKNGSGMLSVPKKGAVVTVEFNGENYYRMVYYAEWNADEDLKSEIKDSYEGAHSLIYDSSAKPGPLKIFYTQSKGLNISLDNAKIQLDTQDGCKLRIVIEMGADQIRMENNKVIIKSNNIELGETAVESLIKGNTFQTFFNSHTHIGNIGSPTSTPVIPSTPTHLSNVSKTK